MSIIKKSLDKLRFFLLRSSMNFCMGNYRKSYSQEGEDLILKRLFEKKPHGFFVDVGAHHPKRFSNTYLLYKKGWTGINIDPMPGSMKCFNSVRKKDINLEFGVGLKEEILDYYVFNDPALNGFSSEISEKRSNDNSIFKIEKKIQVNTYRLSTILDTYLPKNQVIDLLTIDVEGMDLEVLKSNDWDAYKPRYIIIEILSLNFSHIKEDEIYDFLTDHNYVIFAKTVNSVIFKKSHSSE